MVRHDMHEHDMCEHDMRATFSKGCMPAFFDIHPPTSSQMPRNRVSSRSEQAVYLPGYASGMPAAAFGDRFCRGLVDPCQLAAAHPNAEVRARRKWGGSRRV